MPTKQFTKQLRQMPDELLGALVVKIAEHRTPLPKPHTKRRLIEYIVKHKEVLCIKEVKQMDTKNLSDEEIEKRTKQMNFHRIMMMICIDIGSDDCSKYTLSTLIHYIIQYYELPQDKYHLIKDGIYENIGKYVQYLNSVGVEAEFEKVYEYKEKFKEFVFDIIDRDMYFRFCKQSIMCGQTLAEHQGDTEFNEKTKEKHVEDVLFSAIANFDPSKVVSKDGETGGDGWCPGIRTSDLDKLPEYKFHNADKDTGTKEEKIKKMAAVIPDIEEAPEEQEAIPPSSALPVVKVITDVDEAKNIKENVGSLMFPSQYRQIALSEITKSSWSKIRKTHNLKGRYHIYIDSDPGTNPRQNTAIKYTEGHCVDESFEGGVIGEFGMYMSYHPYGDVYLVPS